MRAVQLQQHILASPLQPVHGQARLWFQGALLWSFFAAAVGRAVCAVFTADLGVFTENTSPVYADVEHSVARILLPAKIKEEGTGGVFDDQSVTCGTMSTAGWFLEQPAWSLPDDDRGMDALEERMARFLLMLSEVLRSKGCLQRDSVTWMAFSAGCFIAG